MSRLISLIRWVPRAWLVTVFVLFDLLAAAFVGPVAVEDGDGAEASDPASAATGTPAVESYILDPQLIRTDEGTWAVGSPADGVTMRRYEREDGEWTQGDEVLTAAPAWAGEGAIGPSVFRDGDTWWLLFAAPSLDTGRYCVGAASTADPAEGFEPADEPLHCADDRDLLDPSAYRAGDEVVLTWAERAAVESETSDDTSTDTSATVDETWELEAAPVDLAAGVVDDATVLLTASTALDSDGWEAGVIDAPALVDVGDTLVLLYGGNRWGTADYAAGYAVCETALGPCERRTVDEPLDIRLDENEDGDDGDGDGVTLEGSGGLQPVVGTTETTTVAFHSLLSDPTDPTTAAAMTFELDLTWRDDALVPGTPTELTFTTDPDSPN